MIKKPVLMPVLGLLLFCNTGVAGTLNWDCEGAKAAYDSKDYNLALELTEPALSQNPDDPRCNHLAGRACIKLERYKDAMSHLLKAWKKRQDIPGLKSDIAFLKYKQSDFQSAAILYERIVEEEPENIPAKYYMAVCCSKTGQKEKAATMFAHVKDNAPNEKARENAKAWLEKLNSPYGAKKSKNWRLLLKTGYRYDGNVRFGPLDQDIYGDEGDHCLFAGLYGKYGLVSVGRFSGGIGYGHYQTWHTDLDEYNVTAMTGNIHSKYRAGSVSFGLKYLPAYYAMDSERFLTRHSICPEIMWHANQHLSTGISFGYSDNDYKSEDRDGDTAEAAFKLYWGLGEKGLLSATAGYEDTSASAGHEAFDRLKAGVGIRFDLPGDMSLGLKGGYAKKTHDETDPVFGKKREDDRYALRVSAERGMFYEWLGVMAEYDYARNRSEINLYDYSRHRGTIAVTVDLQNFE